MEATHVRTDEGLVPEGEGWYVLNARDARWFHSDEFARFDRPSLGPAPELPGEG